MTTQREVKRLVRPLLESNRDMRLIDRAVVLLPVRHLVRNIFVDRTRSADLFRPVPAIGMLFEPWPLFPLTYKIMIFAGGHWTLDNSGIGDVLLNRVNEQVLPIFRAVETIEDFDRYCAEQCTHRSERRERGVIHRTYLGAALGDFADVELCLSQLEANPKWWRTRTWTEDDYDRLMDELRPLIRARNRAGIGTFLRGIEAWSAKSLGLEAYWEPTPFPVETRSDG